MGGEGLGDRGLCSVASTHWLCDLSRLLNLSEHQCCPFHDPLKKRNLVGSQRLLRLRTWALFPKISVHQLSLAV